MILHYASAAALFLLALAASSGAVAHELAECPGSQQMHGSHSRIASGSHPPRFVASTAKPFPALMEDAMAVMDDGMRRAPMNGKPEHDFIAMMIPHHQGAIDMAKSVLLYSNDPALRNIALGIITEQQNEINVMRAWLRQYQARQSGGSETGQ